MPDITVFQIMNWSRELLLAFEQEKAHFMRKINHSLLALQFLFAYRVHFNANASDKHSTATDPKRLNALTSAKCTSEGFPILEAC